MKVILTESFKKDFQHLPAHVKNIFARKIKLFMENIHHPSLRVKKMRRYENRWECSITMFYRFTFEVHADHYMLRRIGPHDDVLKNP